MATKTAPTVKPAPASAAPAEPSDADLLTLLSSGSPAGEPAQVDSADSALDQDADDGEDLDQDSEDSADQSGAAAPGLDVTAETDSDQAAPDQAAPGEDDDAAGDADAALDPDDQKTRAAFTPEQQARFDRAVQKKARRILDLKTELEEERQARQAIEQELAQARQAPAPVATAENPLAAIESEEKLEARLADARKLRRFALANPDGAIVDAKTGQVLDLPEHDTPPEGAVQFTKKRIGEILAETEELIQEHAPKRRAQLQAATKLEAVAVQTHPWLKNKNSVGYQAVEASLREAPQLRAIPGARLMLADAFVGRAIRRAQAAKGKPGAAPIGDTSHQRKAPPVPGGGTRPGKIPGKVKAAGQASDTLAKTGDDPGDAALRAILNQ